MREEFLKKFEEVQLKTGASEATILNALDLSNSSMRSYKNGSRNPSRKIMLKLLHIATKEKLEIQNDTSASASSIREGPLITLDAVEYGKMLGKLEFLEKANNEDTTRIKSVLDACCEKISLVAGERGNQPSNSARVAVRG